ncbi:hypothetical protein DFR24_3942 [Panacagrimonas perspica]|uniref:Uncharacterized protein n=1 Tax=Panacagrimonas perspica TaxID=381431 RepID=A0A4S3K692_9GAMM|nr:hypothetical protein [Panacagrimonas perspica]TDU26910.1 hypothetical protein DFR24_3942 [Panacagrimonas perspica]THD03677.1 hypothetical protein B1810_09035 [Panacagrimonas perspica]
MITDVDIKNTVLELFARRGLAQGDVMWLSRLEKFWADTRLRRSDLVTAIAMLCSEHMLVIDEQDGETCLSLSPEGESRAAEILATGVDYWGRYLREELLPGVRTTQQAPGADGGGRRQYEAEAQPEMPWTKD